MNNPTRKNTGAEPLTPRAKVSNSTPRKRRGRAHFNRQLPAEPPPGKVAVDLRDPQGKIWMRLHLNERLQDEVEARAVRDSIRVDEIVNAALRELLKTLGAPLVALSSTRNRRGGAR